MANSVNTAITDLIGRLEAQLDDEYARNHRLVMLMVALVLLFVLLSLLLGWTLNRQVLQPGLSQHQLSRIFSQLS